MRMLVALLLLANLGFFALARGWLQPHVGLSTQHQREPQRLAAQVEPESVRVQAVGTVAPTPATRCIQAGPFGVAQLEALEAALAPALRAPTSWRRQPAELAGDAREPQFWLRVEQPDAALRQQLQELVATLPGAQLSDCAAAR